MHPFEKYLHSDRQHKFVNRRCIDGKHHFGGDDNGVGVIVHSCCYIVHGYCSKVMKECVFADTLYK